MQKLSNDEKVPTFASLLTKFASQINSGYSPKGKLTNLVIRKKTKHGTISLFAVLIIFHREKVFADVLDKKEVFKDYKNNCVQKTQN